MNLGFHQQNVEMLAKQRNGWMGISVLLGVSTLILSLAVFQKSQKIIVVPPSITKSFWIKGDEVSKTYLEEMGVYLAKLLLDLSPNHVDHNHKVLLRYATPEAYGQLEKQFFEEAGTYNNLQLTTHFKPSSVKAFPDHLRVEVKGTLTSFVAGKEVRSSLETLALAFTYRGTGLLLKSATRVIQKDGAELSNTENGDNDDE